MIIVHWDDPDGKGYEDVIPSDWFTNGAPRPKLEHDIRGRHQPPFTARCSLTFDGPSAILDYAGEHEPWNREQGVVIGALKLRFESEQRLGVVKVLWRDGARRRFKKAPATVWIEDDAGSWEGDRRVVTHLLAERNTGLAKRKINNVLSTGAPLSCEACGFDFSVAYGELGAGFCEVHHLRPIAAGVRETPLSDLAILCANCHQMIHRAGFPLISVDEFAEKYVRRPWPWRGLEGAGSDT